MGVKQGRDCGLIACLQNGENEMKKYNCLSPKLILLVLLTSASAFAERGTLFDCRGNKTLPGDGLTRSSDNPEVYCIQTMNKNGKLIRYKETDYNCSSGKGVGNQFVLYFSDLASSSKLYTRINFPSAFLGMTSFSAKIFKTKSEPRNPDVLLNASQGNQVTCTQKAIQL